MRPHKAYLSLGSNLGDRKANLINALDSVCDCCGKIVRVSEFYESHAIGFESKNLFINTCCELQTTQGPKQLLLMLEAIETRLGRNKPSLESEYTDRPIDIDIVFFDDLILNTRELVIPHARMHVRRFVLQPLNELCPDFIHPVFKKSVQELLNECPDTSKLSLPLER